MLKQIEGSHAVAEAVALCRPEVISAYPITPQTHIVEDLGTMVKSRSNQKLRIFTRRIRICRPQRLHRLLGSRCAQLYRDRQSGHAVHDGSGIQCFRHGSAHRYDRRQPRRGRTDQYLE